jgi:DNA adenine methylase
MTLTEKGTTSGTTSGNNQKERLFSFPPPKGERESGTSNTSLGVSCLGTTSGTTSGNNLGSELSEQAATPIVKWVGGKTRLLPELVTRVPQGYRRYFEPFAGGAALFFRLAPSEAVLSDANADLMAMYAAVRDDVEAVIDCLRIHQAVHSKAHYYEVRENWNRRQIVEGWTPAGRAAVFIYLNKTCFNGLWRVNSDGAFNVPMGDYKNPPICNADVLRTASRALQATTLQSGDYRQVLLGAQAGDFVYLDPPYDDTFNAYTSDGAFDQAQLAETARELTARGCRVLLSNSDTPRVRSLYADFAIEVVRNHRSVNADAAGRGDVDELIITNRPRRTIPVTRPPEQQFFDGMRPADEPNVEEVKQAIYLWLDARVSQKRAAEETKQKHAQMLTALADNGLEWHPYLDPETQKKRRVFTEAKPKAKTARMVSESGKRGRRRRGGPSRDIDADLGDDETKEDNEVESRRVPRETVEREIDPFGSTRSKMSGGVLDDAESTQASGKPIPEGGAPTGGGKPKRKKRPAKKGKRK